MTNGHMILKMANLNTNDSNHDENVKFMVGDKIYNINCDALKKFPNCLFSILSRQSYDTIIKLTTIDKTFMEIIVNFLNKGYWLNPFRRGNNEIYGVIFFELLREKLDYLLLPDYVLYKSRDEDDEDHEDDEYHEDDEDNDTCDTNVLEIIKSYFNSAGSFSQFMKYVKNIISLSEYNDISIYSLTNEDKNNLMSALYDLYNNLFDECMVKYYGTMELYDCSIDSWLRKEGDFKRKIIKIEYFQKEICRILESYNLDKIHIPDMKNLPTICARRNIYDKNIKTIKKLKL
jgi:hypothetical protein